MRPADKFRIISETMPDEDNRMSVSLLCDIAGVSRSVYYRWLKSADVRQAREAADRAAF